MKIGKNAGFRPGEIWEDSDGRSIQAHGGGILYDKGRFFWFGEYKGGKTVKGRVEVIGVSCYSSEDLYNWKNEGVVLPAAIGDEKHDLYTGAVLERPKVIYNELTGKYVMWMHIDKADYHYARAGVAISDRPEGPYSYLGSTRPNGCDSRDMTIYKDDDGKAYILYSSEWNSAVHISRLTPDYTGVEPEYTSHFISVERHGSREAPAVFKYLNRYYMITSACTGWDSNTAECAAAENIMGPWTSLGNPCAGPNSEKTFDCQGTFIFKIPEMTDAFIFMADRWNKSDLGDSRYIWLPLCFEKGKLEIKWIDAWNLNYY